MAVIAILLVVILPNIQNSNQKEEQTKAEVMPAENYTNVMKLFKEFNGKEIPVDDIEDEASIRAKIEDPNGSVQKALDSDDIVMEMPYGKRYTTA